MDNESKVRALLCPGTQRGTRDLKSFFVKVYVCRVEVLF